MEEAIQDQENRTLDSSLGNWYGDAEWEPGPIEGQEGMMDFEMPGFCDPKNESLEYPAIKIPKTKELYFYSIVNRTGTGPSGFFDTATITDGANIITEHITGEALPSGWFTGECTFVTPDDWDETQGVLTLTMRNPFADEDHVYVDELSLQYSIEKPPRIDYLPIMGVG